MINIIEEILLIMLAGVFVGLVLYHLKVRLAKPLASKFCPACDYALHPKDRSCEKCGSFFDNGAKSK